MVLVDDRTGSIDIAGHLTHWHVPNAIVRLDFGDVAFEGNGPDGSVTIGVEIKRYHDALNCMGDGRFAGHQLPGLVQAYYKIWLVVEGWYRPDFSTGILVAPGDRKREVNHGSRRFMYRELDNWLTSMEVMAGVRVRRVGDRIEAARFIADLYGWWQKEWEDHQSHRAIHGQSEDIMQIVKPNLVVQVAAQLPGIGTKRAYEVAKRFHTVEDMIGATVGNWQEIEGIGHTMAVRIYNAIRYKW